LVLTAVVVIPISLVVAGIRYSKRRDDAFTALAAPVKAIAVLGLLLGMLLIPIGQAVGTGKSYVLSAMGCVLVVSCTWGYIETRRRVKGRQGLVKS
jgi:hypothetical protein